MRDVDVSCTEESGLSPASDHKSHIAYRSSSITQPYATIVWKSTVICSKLSKNGFTANQTAAGLWIRLSVVRVSRQG